MPSQVKQFTQPHAHTNNAGDGGALSASSSLLGSSLLSAPLSYRRPGLVYISGTTLSSEYNTSTASQTGVLFPDNNYRTDSTSSHIVLDTSRTAIFNGSNRSGLRTGTVANNQVYFVYAVKCSNSSSDFVLVADTVQPLQANYATLNSNFGASSWVYLGRFWNGDSSAAATTIVNFKQSGSWTFFYNTLSTNVANGRGVTLAGSPSASSLTWAYASGTGVAQLPSDLGAVVINVQNGAVATNMRVETNTSGAFLFYGPSGGQQCITIPTCPLDGFKVTVGAATSLEISLVGFLDPILSPGANPLL